MWAEEENLSVQDFIRKKLFGQESITPQIAVKTALFRYKPGETFAIPDIFGDDWNLPNGVAGQFGKKFFALVEKEYGDKLRFMGVYNGKKQALYEVLNREEDGEN